MKQQTILLVCALLVTAMSITACGGGKNCKGGGWYGNRNLTSIDAKKPSVDHMTTLEIQTDICEEVSP